MKEAVLQYIWDKQLFKKNHLVTTKGASLRIISSGLLNREQGPDFSDAAILIDGIAFFGAVEIHIKSSDWVKHQHHYTNVILHVVLHHDHILMDDSGFEIPVLALEHRLIPALIPHVQHVSAVWNRLQCYGYLPSEIKHRADAILNLAGTRRLKIHQVQLEKKLHELDGNWELLAKWILFKTAGQPQNTEPMEILFSQIPWSSLTRKSLSKEEWMVILRGVSGLLKGVGNNDQMKLNQEFKYWSSLFELTPIPRNSWKFGKMRPALQPLNRLRNLAEIISSESSVSIFYKKLLESLELSGIQPSDPAFERLKRTAWGQTLMINAAIPYYSFYSERQHKLDAAKNTTRYWLERLPAEEHRYTRMFREAGFEVNNALKSQGAIQQNRSMCALGQCNQCEIATMILHPLKDSDY